MNISDWEPWVAPFVPGHGKHALDVGGNLGQWSTGLSQRFERVTCLEPTPELAAKIRGLSLPRVTVIEAAAWIENGELRFNVHGQNEHGYGTWSTAVANDLRTETPLATITVKALTIDSLGLPIDFLKIDIEGSEVPALMGAARTIAAHKPAVVVETHNPEAFAWCWAFFDRQGYNMTSINGPGYDPMTPQWVTHRWLFGKYWKG